MLGSRRVVLGRGRRSSCTSTAVGPGLPFRCSEPRMKISYLGPPELPRRHSPRGVRRRDRAGSFAPSRCSGTSPRPQDTHTSFATSNTTSGQLRRHDYVLILAQSRKLRRCVR